jgi:hypothetical protein
VSSQQPILQTNGIDLSLTTAVGGTFNVNGRPVATADTTAVITNDMSLMSSTLANTASLTAAAVAAINARSLQTQQCVGTRMLYDASLNTCVPAVPSSLSFATATRMLAAEQDISGIQTSITAIEVAMNGTSGAHQFCAICAVNFYVSAVCTGTAGTICTPCAAGQYSRGGYAEQVRAHTKQCL